MFLTPSRDPSVSRYGKVYSLTDSRVSKWTLDSVGRLSVAGPRTSAVARSIVGKTAFDLYAMATAKYNVPAITSESNALNVMLSAHHVDPAEYSKVLYSQDLGSRLRYLVKHGF